MHNYTCANCGAPVIYRRKVDTPRCKACRLAEKKRNNREYQRRWQRENYHRRNPDARNNLPRRYWANSETPLTSAKRVSVIGITPGVGDEDWRYYLSAYVGSTFDTMDFVASAEEGCFDGLVVEHNARRYAVRDCKLEEVQR